MFMVSPRVVLRDFGQDFSVLLGLDRMLLFLLQTLNKFSFSRYLEVLIYYFGVICLT